MNEKLAKLEAELSVLEEEMMKSEVISDQPKYQKCWLVDVKLKARYAYLEKMKNMKVC